MRRPLLKLVPVFLSPLAWGVPPLKLGVPLSQPPTSTAIETRTSPVVEEVEVSGTRLYRVTQGRAVLYLPRLERLTPAEFERAICAPAGHSRFATERLVAKAEARVTQKVSVYAGLVNSTYQSKCLPTQGASPTSPHSPESQASRLELSTEVGMSFKPDTKKGPDEYRVFIRPGSATSLGAGINF